MLTRGPGQNLLRLWFFFGSFFFFAAAISPKTPTGLQSRGASYCPKKKKKKAKEAELTGLDAEQGVSQSIIITDSTRKKT